MSEQSERYENKYFVLDHERTGRTADELFAQANNGYIENPDVLKRITEILTNEEKADKAEKVRYMEERERSKDEHDLYSVAQMKLDFLEGNYIGIQDVSIEEGLELTVTYEKQSDMVNITLTENRNDQVATGTALLTFEQFKTMDTKKFDEYVDTVYYYNMVADTSYRRDALITWLNANQQNGYFNGQPEENMDFSTLTDVELEKYLEAEVEKENQKTVELTEVQIKAYENAKGQMEEHEKALDKKKQKYIGEGNSPEEVADMIKGYENYIGSQKTLLARYVDISETQFEELINGRAQYALKAVPTTGHSITYGNNQSLGR